MSEITKVVHTRDGRRVLQTVTSNGIFMTVKNVDADEEMTPQQIAKEYLKRTRRPVPLKELAKGVCQ